jgi:hypothetical protein
MAETYSFVPINLQNIAWFEASRVIDCQKFLISLEIVSTTLGNGAVV